jgi:hypothetical protein
MNSMFQGFETFQKMSKDSLDNVMKSVEQSSKNAQAIAAQMADYSKASFEAGSGAMEKLMGAKSLDKAIEIQSAFAKTAYEGFVQHATKVGELYADFARDAMKPLETVVPAAPKAKA